MGRLYFDRMKIDPAGGHHAATLLLIGGAGGVGSIGIQIAKVAGLRVIATVGAPASHDTTVTSIQIQCPSIRHPARAVTS